MKIPISRENYSSFRNIVRLKKPQASSNSQVQTLNISLDLSFFFFLIYGIVGKHRLGIEERTPLDFLRTNMNDFEPPKEEIFDKFISFVKAVSCEIPGGNGLNALIEIASQFLGNPYQDRRDRWMEKVAETLKELTESEGFCLGDLQANETFIDIVFKTTQVALRNHHEIKRNALINIIRHATQPDPDEVFLQTAINFIDTSTPWHLIILRFVANPRKWEEDNQRKIPNILGIHLYWVLEEAFPDLKDKRDISQQVITDLWSKGLIETHPERETGIFQAPTLESLMKGNITFSGRRILAMLS